MNGAGLSFRGTPLRMASAEESALNPRASLDAILSDPAVVRAASEWRFSAPVSVSHGTSPTLVVLQHEYAVASSSRVATIGCDDVTDGVMLFLRAGKEDVAVAYFDAAAAADESSVKDVVAHMAEGPLRAWVVGGFCDDGNTSGYVLGLVLAGLTALERPVDLQLVCAEKLNDELRADVHFPVVMGAAFVSATDSVVPAHFTHLGPAVGMRNALAFAGTNKGLVPCYDRERDQICIEYEIGDFDNEMMVHLANVPDEFLLENVTQCGKQEPPRFLDSLRAALVFLSETEDLDQVFAKGPKRFKRGPLGAWIKEQGK